MLIKHIPQTKPDAHIINPYALSLYIFMTFAVTPIIGKLFEGLFQAFAVLFRVAVAAFVHLAYVKEVGVGHLKFWSIAHAADAKVARPTPTSVNAHQRFSMSIESQLTGFVHKK